MMLKYIVWFSLAYGGSMPLIYAQGNGVPTTEKDILAEASFIEATTQRILGNYDKAITLYQEILSKDGDNATANFELSQIYEQKKELGEAMVRAERAYTLDKKNHYYALHYAKLLEQGGEYKKASDIFAALCTLYPLETRYYLSWAYLLTKINKEEQAIKVYNTLEEKIGISSELSNRKYKLYLSINKGKLAEKELESLAKALPYDADAHLLLARHYKNTHQGDLAKKAYDKVLEIDPKNNEAILERSTSKLDGGDELGYIESMHSIFESSAHAVNDKNKILQPLVEKTLANSANKNSTYSIALMNLALKNANLHNDNYEANYYCGQLSEFNQEYDLAIKYYTQALKLYKNNLQLWEQTLLLAANTANYDILSTYSNEFFELYPSHLQAYLFEAFALSTQKTYKNATSIAQEGLMMISDQYNYELCLQLVSYLSWQGQKNKEKANKAWARIQELKNSSINLPNDNYYSLILILQSMAAFDKQDYQGIKDILKPIIETPRATPLLLELYGDACAKLEQNAQAVMYWEKAKKQGSHSPLLNKKIEHKVWVTE